MKRDIIIIEDNTISVNGNEIWMTATEIAGLFHTGVPAVNAAIRAVRKPDVLNERRHQSRPQAGRAERLRSVPLHAA